MGILILTKLPKLQVSHQHQNDNIRRQNHSAPLATFNKTLAKSVQDQISSCEAGGSITSGENSAIFYGTGDNPYNAAQITAFSINLWYNEVDNYSNLTKGFTVTPDTEDPNFYSGL